jgi:carboxypeptidase Taq
MKYKVYKSRLVKIADLGYSTAILGWDQETYMPEKGAGFRAQQLATLSGIIHGQFTDKEFGKILKKLDKGNKKLTEKQRKNVTQTLKDYKKQNKYKREFVELLSHTQSECFQAWQKARKENNFKSYAPHLTKLICWDIKSILTMLC